MSSNVIKVFLRNCLDVRLGVKLRKLKSLNRLNDGEKNLIFGLYRQLRYRIRLIKIDDRRKIKFSRCSIFFFFFFVNINPISKEQIVPRINSKLYRNNRDIS